MARGFDLFEVESREALAAAVLAAAQPTYQLARANPFMVVIAGTRCRLAFREGIHEIRAAKVAAQIRKTPAAAFRP